MANLFGKLQHLLLDTASRIFVRLPFALRIRIVKALNDIFLYFSTRP